MVERDPVTTIDQILERIAEARKLREARCREDLDADVMFRLAAERVIEVIGEAVQRLPSAIQDRHPEIPWHRIVGMRNWLAHGYDAVDLEVLWDVLANRIDEIEPLFLALRTETVRNSTT